MDTLRQFFCPGAETRRVLLLPAQALAQILTPKVCFEALLEVYRALAADPESAPKTLGFHVPGGSLHLKAGVYPKRRDVFAAKLNANFPANPERGLPTIQGLVLLVDAANGAPLAVMDSGELTARRTAAAAALAAWFGARRESGTATVIGCGRQAYYVLEALIDRFPLKRVFACDRSPDAASRFVEFFRGKVRVQPCPHHPAGTLQSDIVVTCTTATSPVLFREQVRPGAFVAALGADNPEKHELAGDLFAGAAILVDDRAQAAAIGDLSHALAAGVVGESHVRADLAELASGKKRARTGEQEIVIFDSTGTGVQDVAAARAAWHAATRS